MRLDTSRPFSERAPFALTLTLFLFLALTGGASRSDELSQIVVQIASVTVIAVGLFYVDRGQVRSFFPLIALHLAVVLAVVLQLVPLPPAVWTSLPGREPFTAAATLAGLPQPWRPLSLTPDYTLSSLCGLLVPGAALVCACSLPPRDRPKVFILIACLAALSALIGIIQKSDLGADFLTYRITNRDAPVGLFANRNHQAFLLSLAPPIFATISRLPLLNARLIAPVRIASCAAIVLAAPLILIGGSRGGLLLFPIGCLLALACYLSGTGRSSLWDQLRRNWIALTALSTGVVALALWVIFNGQALSVERLTLEAADSGKRLAVAGPIFELAKTYFPAGTGIGSFPEIFKIHEPYGNLSLTYLNHAHNDFLEVLLEWGILGPVFLTCLIWLWASRSWTVWRNWGDASTAALLARGSSSALAILALASMADYPLRTPIFATIAVLAFACLLGFRKEMPIVSSGRGPYTDPDLATEAFSTRV